MKPRHTVGAVAVLALGLAARHAGLSGQGPLIHVALTYRAPGDGPSPNFSPKGTLVPLTPLPAGAMLPPGAVRPAKTGTIAVGPNRTSWIPVLATADAEHPNDLCRIFLDRNRNGNFADDGPAVAAVPRQNEKTKAWWSSFNKIALSIPYGGGRDVEPYMVNVWIVREDDAAPDVGRYSVASWRSGTVSVNGVDALVAAMDGNNDGIFAGGDYWSVVAASAPDAANALLSHTEARPTSRLMFLPTHARELVLEFRSFSADGRSIDFAVVDRPTTKASDRAADDFLASERSRPRTATTVVWQHDWAAALAQSRSAGRPPLIDFEATWCGPCKSMDEWIWTDAEVAARLQAGYIGVKLDGDIEKTLAARFKVAGYPTIIALDSSGRELQRVVGYQSSSQMLAFLSAARPSR